MRKNQKNDQKENQPSNEKHDQERSNRGLERRLDEIVKQLDEQRTLSTNRSKDLPQPYSQEHQKEAGGQSQMQRYANNNPAQRKHNQRNEAQNFMSDQPESRQQLPQFLNHTQQIDQSETPIEEAGTQLAYFSQKPAE